MSHYTLSQNENIFNQMKEDVTYLSSDKLKGRKTGTRGEKRAANYIRKQFHKHNLAEKGTKGYYQDFVTKHNNNPHSNINKNKIKGLNVIGFCDNKQKETIIIGAHYDHLGKTHQSSLHKGSKDIHNGADDNASGVSILTSLIDTLCNNQLYNYLFIAFSGEEEGLLGSSFFCKNPTIKLNTVKFMLNFDMVGRLNDKQELAINGTGTSKAWNEGGQMIFEWNYKDGKEDGICKNWYANASLKKIKKKSYKS